MSFSPIVSVVIPFYSSQKGRLVHAVNSALGQTVRDIEVIIVDDKSPVSAKTELKNISDSRVSFLEHKRNLNGAIARNTGVSAAKGRYIAFLDYDDIWFSGKLERQIDKLEKAKKSGVFQPVIYGQCEVVEQEVSYIKPERAIRSGESVGDYLFVGKQIIQTSGILLESAIAKKVKFDDLKRHQDYQFCLALEKYGCTFILLSGASYQFIQVPKLNDFHFSIYWLTTYHSLMSNDAVRGFQSLVVLRSMVQNGCNGVAFSYAAKQRMIVKYIFLFGTLWAKSMLSPVYRQRIKRILRL